MISRELGVNVERFLRVVALLIVIVAVIDPSITTNRTSKPELSLVVVDSAQNATLLTEVKRSLASTFTVVGAPISNASASVVVGSAIPASIADLSTPLFNVSPDQSRARITVEEVSSSAHAPLATRVPVDAQLRVTAAEKQSLTVSLLLDGMVVDQVVRTVLSRDEHLRIPLSFIPVAVGTARLQVTATVNGAAKAVVDRIVDVRDQRWAILFFDPRPSWMSTFVRRVAERDARFIVSSRVTSSKGVSRDAGTPPSSLDDPAIRALYDVIVVGAPEALSDRDVAGLEVFLRRRGGAVILLFDQRATGKYDRLIAAGAWDGISRSVAVNIAADADSVALRATEWMWPSRLDVASDVLAWTSNTSRDTVKASAKIASEVRRPMVWRTAVGAGRVIVSGALDAWKFRDPAQSHFESFWRTTLADAASESPRAIVASVTPSVATPHAELRINVESRDAMLVDLQNGVTSRASVSASLMPASTPTVVRLWPTGQAGAFSAVVRAPGEPGSYRVHVVADGFTEDIPFEVAPVAAQPIPADSDMLGAWVKASGGAVVPASQVGKLARRIEQSLKPLPRRVSWHPMRSLWWLPALFSALCIEWWLRRRRGLA